MTVIDESAAGEAEPCAATFNAGAADELPVEDEPDP